MILEKLGLEGHGFAVIMASVNLILVTLYLLDARREVRKFRKLLNQRNRSREVREELIEDQLGSVQRWLSTIRDLIAAQQTHPPQSNDESREQES